MGMPTDVELDSSTSTLENDYAQPAVDTVAESNDSNEAATAGSGEGAGKQSDSPAAESTKQPKSSDRAKNSLEKALEHLTKKSSKSDEEKPDVTAAKKPDAKAPVKADAKPKAQEAKKDAPKAVDEPTADELRAIYELEQGLKPNDEVIAYCRIGERSSHTWFVLTYLLGYTNVKNYDGSWTEWGNAVRAPIKIGTQP